MQKKAEVKMLLELANHHASFAIDPVLKTEGVIDLIEDEAQVRFEQRMWENGGYRAEQQAFLPSDHSVTTDRIPFASHYIDFRAWRQDWELSYRYDGKALTLERITPGPARPEGGRLLIRVIPPQGEELSLAPKMMAGPSHIVVAYVDERPFLSMLPAHSFPVVSVEEVKR